MSRLSSRRLMSGQVSASLGEILVEQIREPLPSNFGVLEEMGRLQPALL